MSGKNQTPDAEQNQDYHIQALLRRIEILEKAILKTIALTQGSQTTYADVRLELLKGFNDGSSFYSDLIFGSRSV